MKPAISISPQRSFSPMSSSSMPFSPAISPSVSNAPSRLLEGSSQAEVSPSSFLEPLHRLANTRTTSLPPTPLSESKEAPSGAQGFPVRDGPELNVVKSEQNHVSYVPPSLIWRIAVDWWVLELAAAAVSLGTIAAICGVIIAYDQKPVPELPHGITLNAVISFLATIAKSALLVAVAAAISQDKWLWFLKGSRELDYIDDFEDASRGPFGSLIMILKWCGSLNTILAAVVTVCAIGFEPFLQQLVIFPFKEIAIPGAVASILTPTTLAEDYSGLGLLAAATQLTAFVGCFGGASGVVPAPHCPGGSCVWPAYHSLALCTSCKDMTDKISITGEIYNANVTEIIADHQNSTKELVIDYNTTYSLPRGRNITAITRLDLVKTEVNEDQLNVFYPRRLSWPLNIDPTADSDWMWSWGRETYAGIDGPLLAMGYLDLNISNDLSRIEVKQALECVLTPCVREYKSKMQGGKLTSTVLSTDYGTVRVNETVDQYSGAGWEAFINGTQYAVTDQGLGDLSGNAYILVQSIRAVLQGDTFYSVGVECQDNDCFTVDSTDYAVGQSWSSTAQQAIDLADNFTQVVDNVATALTGRFQQLATLTVEGQVLQTFTFVEVRWVWIAYPVTLVVLGIGTLLFAILQTQRSRIPIWKSSVLPLLYRYHKQGVGSADASHDAELKDSRVSALQMASMITRARLGREGGSGVWVLREEAQGEVAGG